MKISMRRFIVAGSMFAFCTLKGLAVDATYNNLEVNGQADFTGANTTFGTSGTTNPGVTLNYVDGTSGVVSVITSKSSAIWQWGVASGTSSLVSMKLDAVDQLILYTTGTGGAAGITLNPVSTGTSVFAGSVTIGGTNNILPNQVLLSGSSILTRSLADARYVQIGNITLGGTASGSNSIAAGNSSVASGSASMAIGNADTASGNYSVALGDHTAAQGQGQLVIGQYNSPLGSGTSVSGTNPLFIIGNGTSGTSTSNALVVLKNGFVGIGTSTPSQQLEITGNIQIPASGSTGGVIYQSGTRILHSSGSLNFFAGPNAGTLSVSGMYNTAFGRSALTSITSGGANVAVGDSASWGNTSGGSNVAVGVNALNNNQTGGGNVAVGYNSLVTGTTNYYNVAVGFGALDNISGTAAGVWDNTAVGASSMDRLTTGQSNSALGYSSLIHITTGNNNTAVGFGALPDLTTGGGNVAVGEYAGGGSGTIPGSVTDTYMTYIGFSAHRDTSVSGTTTLTNSVAIGHNASVGASNSMILGGTGSDAVKVGVGNIAPAYTVDVAGDINFTGNLYRNGTLVSGTGATGVFGAITIGSGSLSNGGFVALGGSSVASGASSMAMGQNAVASGSKSTAIGFGASATGTNSFALGGTAGGYGATALGPFSIASGDYSIAGPTAEAGNAGAIGLGYEASATGYFSVAIGGGANAWTDDSIAFGEYAETNQNTSIAIGPSAGTWGYDAIAIGDHTYTNGENALAIGCSAYAQDHATTAVGMYATSYGEYSTAVGSGAYTTGSYAQALGTQTAANADYATAIGYQSIANGLYSTAAAPNTTSNAYAQFVVGQYNLVQGTASSWVGTDNLFVVGNGVDSSNLSNAFVINQNGDAVLSGVLTISGTTGNPNKITSGGLVVTSGTDSHGTYVVSGTNQSVLVPQDGDLSMGAYTSGPTPH